MGVGVELDQADALMNAGHIPQAIAILSRIIAKKPKESRALHSLGVANALTGRHQEAESLLQRAKALKPQSAQILTDLATVLVMLRRDAEALALLEKACKREPDLRLPVFYRGVALTNLRRHDEALAVFERLLQIDPANAVYQQNYATVLSKLDRFEEAEAIVDRLLARGGPTRELMPLKYVAVANRENVPEALNILDRFIGRTPDHVEAVLYRGYLNLLRGKLLEGWSDYEARLRRPGISTLPAYDESDVPHWHGEPIQGRSLLVYSEQGLGDLLLMGRYIPLLVERGAEVIFQVPAFMTPILRTLSDRVRYVDAIPTDNRPDYQIPLMSLPHRFKTELSTIPPTPYLFADTAKVAYWRDVIGTQGFKIGLAWQGNPDFAQDTARSIPLRDFYPLSQIPGVRLISLQKNHGLEQLADLPGEMTIETLDSSGTDGFVDAAAVMRNLDFVVSCDTAIANLAGALGVEGCVAVPHLADWRWLFDVERSPWFPTLRVCRRGKTSSWHGVVEQICRHIELTLSPDAARLPMDRNKEQTG
jgi:Flp pilus assembly protein TadD